MKVLNLSFLFTGALGQAIFHQNSAGELFASTSAPASQNYPFYHPAWRKINAAVADISCNSSNDCWAVTSGGQLFYFGNIIDGSPLWRFKYMTSKARTVSVADDGTVWGITTNNEIFKGKDGAAFEHVGVGLDVAAISYNEALVVGTDGQLYHRHYGNWALKSELGADRLIKVSRCANNDIWAIRNDGAIWRQVTNRVRGLNFRIEDVTLSGVKPNTYATDIVCKNNRIYHVNGNQDVFIYIFDKYDSNNWQQIPVTKAVKLA